MCFASRRSLFLQIIIITIAGKLLDSVASRIRIRFGCLFLGPPQKKQEWAFLLASLEANPKGTEVLGQINRRARRLRRRLPGGGPRLCLAIGRRVAGGLAPPVALAAARCGVGRTGPQKADQTEKSFEGRPRLIRAYRKTHTCPILMEAENQIKASNQPEKWYTVI